MPLLTDLDIVNAACAQVGEEPLGSLDEEVDAGQAAELLYNEVLEFNLDLFKFSFAKQIRQLSRNTLAAALAGYDYVFDLPAERIGPPIYLTDDPTDPDRRYYRYALVGAQAHADDNPLYAMILFRAAPYQWSGTFKSAMVTSLAARLAITLCHDRGLSQDKHQEAYGTPSQDFRGGLMGAAIRADSFTNPPRNQQRDDNPLTSAWTS